MKRRVVVTGGGAITPLGNKLETVWPLICNGESGIGPLTTFDASLFRSQIGGEASCFSTEGYLDHREAGRVERFAQLATVAAMDAVKQSGIDFDQADRRRCASIVGSGVGGLYEVESQHDRLRDKGPKKISVFTIPKMMPNAASGHISIAFGLLGPSMAVTSACASASNAIINAAKLIQYGEMDVAVAGGSEAACTMLGIAGFCAMRALSERNDDPKRASRPFDRDRDGFVLSEGAGIVVLEELEHAKQRGAEILCEVVGWGETSDAGHITQPDSGGRGAGRAMQNAVVASGLNPSDIDYINAHGTSTVLGDIAETVAIKSVFGEPKDCPAISSTKSQIGHLLGGSGGVELILTILAMRNGVIPPTINLENPDPKCDLDYTPNTAREVDLKYCMSNSFGFGGHNASIIVGPVRDAS